MATLDLTEKNFDSVIDKSGIVLVDWWASWCGPCRAFAPVFSKAAEKHPDITFAKVDTEEQRRLAAAFEIRSIPTLMIFRDGVLLYAQPGALPAPALEELVRKTRALDMDRIKKEIEESDKKKAGATAQA